MPDIDTSRSDRPQPDRARARLIGFLAGLVIVAAIASAQASATTEPAQTDFDRIVLTDDAIVLPVSKVDVGTLVVFLVKNKSSHPRSVIVGSYKSKVLKPGKQIQFELSFPVPWTFNIRSLGKHLPTLTAKFVCTF